MTQDKNLVVVWDLDKQEIWSKSTLRVPSGKYMWTTKGNAEQAIAKAHEPPEHYSIQIVDINRLLSFVNLGHQQYDNGPVFQEMPNNE